MPLTFETQSGSHEIEDCACLTIAKCWQSLLLQVEKCVI